MPASLKTKKKKPASQPASNGKPPPSPEDGMPVIYPELRQFVRDADHEGGPLTCGLAKEMLGWQTEQEYQEEVKAGLDPESQAGFDSSKVTFGSDYFLKDEEGNKVRLRFNAHNRPYDEQLSRAYAQEVLNKRWAGPTAFPGTVEMVYGGTVPWTLFDGTVLQPGGKFSAPAGTVNAEPIVLSRAGIVHSGQHRLIGLVLARQMWEKNKEFWSRHWETEPVLETTVAVGVSSLPEIIRTIDSGRTRTEADVFYTSPLFQEHPTEKRPFSNNERRTCCKALQSAVDFLWKRTGAGEVFATHYKSNSEASSFAERHPKLLDCILHIFVEDGDGVISSLTKMRGQAAGIMYLMASSGSDGDVYRVQDPRAEECLDWSQWDKASDFWALLGKSPTMTPCKDALEHVTAHEEEELARKRLVILCKAWTVFKAGHKLTADDLQLRYVEQDGVSVLADHSDFGGIDLSDEKKTNKGDREVVSPDELERNKETVRKAKAREDAAKVADPEAVKRYNARRQLLARMHQAHPEATLFLESTDGKSLAAWHDDAKAVFLCTGAEPTVEDGMGVVRVPSTDLGMVLGQLRNAGHTVLVLRKGGKDWTPVAAQKSQSETPPLPDALGAAKPAPRKRPVPKPATK